MELILQQLSIFGEMLLYCVSGFTVLIMSMVIVNNTIRNFNEKCRLWKLRQVEYL